MKKLLGLDEMLLSQIDSKERLLFLYTSRLFLVVVILSFIANGYFGWMMNRNISSVLLMACLIGFIHFSVLRIAILTMISLPLIKSDMHKFEKSRLIKPLVIMKSTLSFASVVRFVFVGCIAISVAFPLVSIVHHQESERLNDLKRNEVIQHTIQLSGTVDAIPENLMNELAITNYPFFVFRAWLGSSVCIIQLILITTLFYAPFAILWFIKSNPNFTYAEKSSASAYQSIESDYLMTMEECQWFMSKHYPEYKVSLNELCPYSDPPFNSKLKNVKNRNFGTDVEFQQKIQLM